MNTITSEEVTNSPEFLSRLQDILDSTGIKVDGSATKDQILLTAKLEMAAIPDEVTVSANETRQVVQYNPNGYFASVKLDLSDVKGIVESYISSAEEGAVLEAYLEAKKIMYSVIRNKIAMHEEFLRAILKEQQSRDGVTNV